MAYPRWTAEDDANLARVTGGDAKPAPRKAPKKKDPKKVKAGGAGLRALAARNRLIRAHGPTEILDAMSAVHRMRRAGQDPYELRAARQVRRALGPAGRLFYGHRMPRPVLTPMVWALEEATQLIGAGGLVADAPQRLAGLQAACQARAAANAALLWNHVNPGVGRTLSTGWTEAAQARFRHAGASPDGIPILVIQWNLARAIDLLTGLVHASPSWWARFSRCGRFPKCRGTPFGVRGSDSPKAQLCATCGGQGNRALPPRLRQRKRKS
jgi:hypothetical protein